jgi:hypothetical protein
VLMSLIAVPHEGEGQRKSLLHSTRLLRRQLTGGRLDRTLKRLHRYAPDMSFTRSMMTRYRDVRCLSRHLIDQPRQAAREARCCGSECRCPFRKRNLTQGPVNSAMQPLNYALTFTTTVRRGWAQLRDSILYSLHPCQWAAKLPQVY